MAASLTRIRADSASLGLARLHEKIEKHMRRSPRRMVILGIVTRAILDDKIGGSLRIVPGEMNTLRREINGFEGFDRLSGRQPFLTAPIARSSAISNGHSTQAVKSK